VSKYDDRVSNEAIVAGDKRHHWDGASADRSYDGQVDIWCQKSRNLKVTPFYPETCAFFENLAGEFKPYQINSVPWIERESHAWVHFVPETKSLQYNFHDADALAATPFALWGR
jgi:hypothetical protein